MNKTSDIQQLLAQLSSQQLPAEQEESLRQEVLQGGEHRLPLPSAPQQDLGPFASLYAANDMSLLQAMSAPKSGCAAHIRTLDELLERDRQREKDGFPRKIQVGRLIKPQPGAGDKVVVVPTTVEEKLIHDNQFSDEQGGGGGQGGSGEGAEGEVIGEAPVRPEGQGEGTGAGEGKEAQHEVESSAYDLGRILTEKFELPNLKNKGKKSSLTRYTYDLTDRNRGFGQLLDKKATLRRVLETNIALGNVDDQGVVDPASLLIAPRDKVYRVLSPEKDYESQAMVFFLRDYSGSMHGKATELVVSQHVMIYSWLLYQFSRQVETRFILHDTEAREVPDFYTYYNMQVAGGTRVMAAYKMVNEIVERENLARDYNIYVFHGTDGDDWDSRGKETLPELKTMLTYASRVGITVAEHIYGADRKTQVETYVNKSGLLDTHGDLLRLDSMGEDAPEERIIEGIKKLISQS